MVECLLGWVMGVVDIVGEVGVVDGLVGLEVVLDLCEVFVGLFYLGF